MQPSNNLVSYAIQVATKTARRCRLDPDTTISVACDIALKAAAKVDTEPESFKLFSYIVKRRLVSRVCTELQVFGPTVSARAKRRARKQTDINSERESFEVHITAPKVRRSNFNLVDFFDQFSHDPKLTQYILLVLAGHSQAELIREYGFTRTQISRFKESIEHVYKKSAVS